ncbi:MAG: glutathione binding-like protein [Proteobacteria bacterium]|nr:glutathione binding-like protein [Pseudomonadota bacterium]MDA1022447.1 glutathione binding-like protein [Pseudomonadota bacterium]
MIELYTWATPNGRKVSVMLEELGLEYNVHEVDISKGQQHEPEFLAISPNNRIPGIIDMDTADGEPLKMFETGAILIYLAEKTGSGLLPTEIRPRTEVLQWLMWQMGGVGPMFGQAHVFMFNPKEEVPQAVERYHKETKRLYKVMNEQLGKARYLANDNFSIADIATFPWVDRYPRHQVDLAEFPNVLRWHTELWERPAVKKGMEVPFYNT